MNAFIIGLKLGFFDPTAWGYVFGADLALTFVCLGLTFVLALVSLIVFTVISTGRK